MNMLPSTSLDTSVEGLKNLILNHLKFSLARDQKTATRRDWWLACSKAVQSLIVERMMATQEVYYRENARRVYYLSLEFLMGRLFSNNIYSAGVHANLQQALMELGLNYEELRNEEYDMGLGNGGLGRLAACFLDSLATLDLPAVGYGIHYRYGLFRQIFRNGYQVELPDAWIQYGSPWEIIRPEHAQTIQLYGHVENVFDNLGNSVPRWAGYQEVVGLPFDIPIAGYGTRTVGYLRLWESRATEDFDFEAFNRGGYEEAVRQKTLSETISKVLYPNDNNEQGKELRLVQQYFFVACSLRDILRRFFKTNADLRQLPEKACIHLNDTHPAIAVAELQRLLHDEHGLPWEDAWSIVTRTIAYTNHTLLPEALEKWSVELMNRVLPRHMQIIFEINKRHLDEVEKRFPGDLRMKQIMSLIEEGPVKMVRMAHLAIVGSFSVNGVAELHTRLLRTKMFPEFDAFYPGKFNNKTNGITPRRWLLACNPRLAQLITSRIGDGWERDLMRLRALEPLADDPDFQNQFLEIKRANKAELAMIIERECGVKVSADALFDVQIKRLHEYKRQHLNLLHILALYRRLLQHPESVRVPRVFIFAAKAAPGYEMAKIIIKAINSVAAKINADPRVNGMLKIAFLPNYRVSLAQRIIPAADLSEQISTAGKEASGTGNMKLALNGAITIGTLDGANIEIRDEVGAENVFIFGLTVEEVEALRARGYKPWELYEADEELRAVVDWVGSNYFTPDEPPRILESLRDNLIHHDPYLCLADFRSYSDCQQRVDEAYRDRRRWARMAILNTARCGKFSSDRTILEYAREIWKLPPVPVD